MTSPSPRPAGRSGAGADPATEADLDAVGEELMNPPDPDGPEPGGAEGLGAAEGTEEELVGGGPGPGGSSGALAEMEDRWRRAMADLDNLRKRHAREAGRERQDERNRVSAQWLPVVDNLELALGHADPADPVVQGLKAIHQQAVQVLAHLGYVRHDEVGVPFDPRRHEVVSVVEAPGAAPNTVVQVTSPGYGEDTHQLRPATVVVSRAPAGSGTPE